jgi:hypothetical protein
VTKCDCCPETPGVLECALGCDCRCHDLSRQLAEAQAQMGAMREALIQATPFVESFRPDDAEAECDQEETMETMRAALAPEAGKELLARLEKAEGGAKMVLSGPPATEIQQVHAARLREGYLYGIQDAVKVLEQARGAIRALYDPEDTGTYRLNHVISLCDGAIRDHIREVVEFLGSATKDGTGEVPSP